MWGSAACPPPAAAGLRPAITSKQAPAPARTIFLIRTVSPPGHLGTGESSSPARKIPAPAWDGSGSALTLFSGDCAHIFRMDSLRTIASGRRLDFVLRGLRRTYIFRMDSLRTISSGRRLDFVLRGLRRTYIFRMDSLRTIASG